MNRIFRPYLRKFVFIFFDNILIYNPNMATHKDHLLKVFDVLKSNQLHVNDNKCQIGKEKLKYLGH